MDTPDDQYNYRHFDFFALSAYDCLSICIASQSFVAIEKCPCVCGNAAKVNRDLPEEENAIWTVNHCVA